ncbi:dienelactone hydrolase family protein [Cellulomonas wangsupingiae]|uniref:Alpha/beta hydrolase n=1 Tax=Cellulomonas wangsupingiae TaxID=2968085 RepID=A0ABY5K542_9CELL|nr:alpha/beta hydrolase [Cellulomonas wangsupingiae]MCC2333824.1 alpha/beta hydrolase [Cellulomonas wangsupingiae]UUI65085.1 alpha/beta hydrolase [Cellulomonas wangsupingiae]
MRFTSEQHLDDGVLARELVVGEIPGTLWTPRLMPAPLILMAHNNGLPRTDARLVARARYVAAEYGYAVASIDAAGCGDRPRSPSDERARAELRRAVQAGEQADELLESVVGPLVEAAAPDWRTALDALLALPGITGPVGYSGWAALGIRLAAVEPRIAAVCLYAGGYVPRAQREEARRVTAPLLLLLQWDDEGNPRRHALDLFDAFGSTERTLHANRGGHLATPRFELEDSCRFHDRHLR